VTQAVSRRFFNAKVGVQSSFSQCEIYGGKNDTVTGFSQNTLVLTRQCHSVNAPYSFIYRGRCIRRGGKSLDNRSNMLTLIQLVPGLSRG
jgi:hypothetical protein